MARRRDSTSRPSTSPQSSRTLRLPRRRHHRPGLPRRRRCRPRVRDATARRNRARRTDHRGRAQRPRAHRRTAEDRSAGGAARGEAAYQLLQPVVEVAVRWKAGDVRARRRPERLSRRRGSADLAAPPRRTAGRAGSCAPREREAPPRRHRTRRRPAWRWPAPRADRPRASGRHCRAGTDRRRGTRPDGRAARARVPPSRMSHEPSPARRDLDLADDGRVGDELQQLALVLHVVVDGHRGDVELGRERTHRQPVEPDPLRDPDRRVDDLVTPEWLTDRCPRPSHPECSLVPMLRRRPATPTNCTPYNTGMTSPVHVGVRVPHATFAGGADQLHATLATDRGARLRPCDAGRPRQLPRWRRL